MTKGAAKNASNTREFRVLRLERFQITAFDERGVRVLAENLTLQQANEIAAALGRANPEAVVRPFDAPEDGRP